ncbi:MAG: Grx4 family monothiol glutaredoxin [Pseudomonadota bacterium]|nr:Grx4 family monothiol glutaredoxin [Pseudomonadota bacterium]
MSLDTALRQRIESLFAAHHVLLFMKGEPQAPQCGFSAKAIGALDALGVDYGHVDVLADGEMREGIKAYGEWPTIPQLYVNGELVGGSDIIEQMASSGELHSLLGVAPPDRTPPQITLTPAAAQMLRKAIDDAGGEVVVKLDIDPRFRTRLHLAPDDPRAITSECDGIRLQFDLAGARRAAGLTVDWADDARGRGLIIDNPNAPPRVNTISVGDARDRVAAGSLRIVDVRPGSERAMAALDTPFLTLDDGLAPLQALPNDTPLAFLCHHGSRSAEAAEHFRELGYREVYNIEGGIDAWADTDPGIARY